MPIANINTLPGKFESYNMCIGYIRLLYPVIHANNKNCFFQVIISIIGHMKANKNNLKDNADKENYIQLLHVNGRVLNDFIIV